VKRPGLARTLGTIDATAIALGAIIGAGIFVTISAAAASSGTSFLLAIPIAALIAFLSGLSATELGITIPRAGGTYEFAGCLISRGTGFIIGWIFLLAGITASSTYVLAFTGYLQPLLPGVPLRLVAPLLALLATAIAYIGIRFSVITVTVLVIVKIIVLVLFVVITAPAVRLENLPSLVPESAVGLFRAVALMFFAFTGFARPVTLAEEVKSPETTLPRSLVISISASMVLYLAVSFAALGVLGVTVLSDSLAPLSLAAANAAGQGGALLISIGAFIAIASILLAEVLGLSRVVYAMSRNGDLPHWFGSIHPRYKVPGRAVILIGITAAALSAVTDLSSVLAASSLALLLYYGLTNLTALRLGERKLYGRTISVLGFIATISLALTLPATTILINAIVIAAGLAYYYLIKPRVARPPG